MPSRMLPDAGPGGAPGAARSFAIVALLCAGGLIAARTPRILLAGRFWAEEATFYFRDALLGGWWDALLAPRSGYYSSWTKLAALAATAVPLEWAPLVTVFAALAVQLAVTWIALRSDIFRGILGKLLAASVILFVPSNAEVWLNTANSHFHFALGAALLVLVPTDARSIPLRFGFLALAGTTGPVTAFLAPFFLWRAVRQPTWPHRAEAFLVGLCALLQGWLMLLQLLANARPAAFSLPALISVLSYKLLALPWLGAGSDGVARILLGGSLAAQLGVTALLAAIGGLLGAVLIANPAARLLLGMAVLVAIVSFAGALSIDPWAGLQPIHGDRYAYVPNALIGLALVLVATGRQSRPWRRIAAALLLGAFLVNGVASYVSPSPLLAGPDWRAAVAAWRSDPGSGTLAIWPRGWTLAVPAELARR